MPEENGALRAYVVLRAAQDGVTYTHVGEGRAHSAKAACRALVESDPQLVDGGLDFVAIPEGTWRSNRTTIQVQQQLKITATASGS